MLCEVGQKVKDKYHIISPKKNKTKQKRTTKINELGDTQNKWMVARWKGVRWLDEKDEGIKKYELVISQ